MQQGSRNLVCRIHKINHFNQRSVQEGIQQRQNTRQKSLIMEILVIFPMVLSEQFHQSPSSCDKLQQRAVTAFILLRCI